MTNPKIRERLEEISRSQGWLAEQTGYTTEYINRIINGKVKNPGIEACKKIAKALGKLIEELFI